jgi:DNA-binding NarL/FixJ family response regulator
VKRPSALIDSPGVADAVSVQATERFDQAAYDQILASIREPLIGSRDLEIPTLLATGFSLRQAAERCSISVQTARSRVNRLRRRFRARTTLGLLLILNEQGHFPDQIATKVIERAARAMAEQERQEADRQAVSTALLRTTRR